MALWVDSYWGRLDYEQFQKLRNMDPGRAEKYKKEAWEKYQSKRIIEAVNDAKSEYEENIQTDPENKDQYLMRFRTRILEITWIEKNDQYKALYLQCKDEQSKLDLLESQVSMVTSANPDVFQEGMDEMGTDTPDFVQSAVEREEAAIVDARTAEVPEQEEEQPVVTDVPVDPVDPIENDESQLDIVDKPKVDINELQAKYFEKTGKEAPARFKYDADRLQSKIK